MLSYQSRMPVSAGTPGYEDWRHPCLPWIPAPYRGSGCAFAGKTKWGRLVVVGGGIAVDVLSRNVSAWIPAFAGMTNSGGPEL